MTIASQKLLDELSELTQQFIDQAQVFEQLPLEVLNWKADQDSWSILECLEHLNLYGDFYIPEIGQRIAQSKKAASETFKSGWVGNYLAKGMIPQEGMSTMNTFKSKNPNGSDLDKSTIQRFLKQQAQFLELLAAAQNVNLQKTKTKTTLPILRLRLGDTLRFVINHNLRHVVQAERAMKAAKVHLNLNQGQY